MINLSLALSLTILWFTAFPLEGADLPPGVNVENQVIAVNPWGPPQIIKAAPPVKQKKPDRNKSEDLEKQLEKLKNPFIPQIPMPVSETSPPTRVNPTGPVSTSPPKNTGPKEKIAKPNYSLSGLIWNTDRPQAILNGKIVGLGDTVDQWTITHIDKTGVEISYQDKKFLIERQGVNYAK